MDPKLIRSIPQVKLSSKKLQKVSEIKDQQIALPMVKFFFFFELL
jgi:hypothetical protein